MSTLVADYVSSDEESSLSGIVAPDALPLPATHEEEDVDGEDDDQLRLQAREDAFGLRMAQGGIDASKRADEQRQTAVMAAPDVLREVGSRVKASGP